MEWGAQKNHVLGSAVCAVASGQFALPDERQKSHLIPLSVTNGAYFAEMSMGQTELEIRIMLPEPERKSTSGA